MKNLLTFLLNVSRLKTVQRTGWVLRGVKNPETIAEHSFRIAWLAWALGSYAGLRVHRAIQMALLHDVCEVYSGDLPFWYGILGNPRDPRQRAPFLTRWIRLAQRRKARIRKEKFLLEQKALRKLVGVLLPRIRKEILAHWLEFEKGSSREGKFVKQIDTIEPLLQAIEYFGTAEGTPVDAWWEMAEEIVDDPLLVKFLKTIERHLYYGERTPLDGTLEFLNVINALKRKPRPAWLARKVKNPDSLANHTFMATVMSWLFVKEWHERLRLEKVLKMALCCSLFRVTLTDRGLYDTLLMRTNGTALEGGAFREWVRSSLKLKREVFRGHLKRRTAAVRELTRPLEPRLREEIRQIFGELQQNQTPEARFVNQVQGTELLLQALQYWQKDKRFAIEPWWERMYEVTDNPHLLEFLDALKKKFRVPTKTVS